MAAGIVIIALIIIMVTAVVWQIKFSKKSAFWPGLILPLSAFAAAVLTAIFCVGFQFDNVLKIDYSTVNNNAGLTADSEDKLYYSWGFTSLKPGETISYDEYAVVGSNQVLTYTMYVTNKSDKELDSIDIYEVCPEGIAFLSTSVTNDSGGNPEVYYIDVVNDDDSLSEDKLVYPEIVSHEIVNAHKKGIAVNNISANVSTHAVKVKSLKIPVYLVDIILLCPTIVLFAIYAVIRISRGKRLDISKMKITDV